MPEYVICQADLALHNWNINSAWSKGKFLMSVTCHNVSVPSASQAQNHPHDRDQQEHEDQATDYWQEGETQ